MLYSNRIESENPEKDVVYFRNDYEDAVMRQVKGDRIYIKFKGKAEFEAGANNGVVLDAIADAQINYIDKSTYDSW